MPPTAFPTEAMYMANEVNFEYARLKGEKVEKIDFSHLLTMVIRGHGIKDPAEISRLRKEISQIRHQERAKKSGGQKKFRFHIKG
ncbi:MAG: hypothetical protein WC657_04200 [Candidatus Paceibacterota bacterium]|jgi:hypothetical protein